MSDQQQWYSETADHFARCVAHRLQGLAHVNRCDRSEFAIIGQGIAREFQARHPSELAEATRRGWIKVHP